MNVKKLWLLALLVDTELREAAPSYYKHHATTTLESNTIKKSTLLPLACDLNFFVASASS